MKSYVGISDPSESVRELNPSRIARDQNERDLIMNHLSGTRNLFETKTSRTKLCSFNTGKVTSDKVAKYLLGVPEDGRKCHQEFVQVCVENPSKHEILRRAEGSNLLYDSAHLETWLDRYG